ncbi:DNA helicase [Agrobacterium phage Atu_ph03]|uniref:DNA helicase n=2 Tax=Atuphduovirus TaxID=2731928 RepID=A0A223W0D4_9CAUD|nr:DNA helicase [Agrobacterium phage Atu_ph02]YP_009791847.1 DNA helicase [Agrobacterium phage Atu_ph03]ASV44557.1 DNA helicase [Agrobacterium phage Atu_ph02]AUZ94769.1 DNA helicase [Agrobacterium phage Atu_ph03]
MAIDAVLLRLMRERKMFAQLYSAIPEETPVIEKETRAVLRDFERYYKAYPSHDHIDKETFVPRFMQWHPSLKDEQKLYYMKLLDGVWSKEADEDQRTNIMSWLAELEMATSMANLTETFNSGDLDEDFYAKIIEITDQYKKRVDVRFDRWIDDPIFDLLLEDLNDDGVAWRLNCMNKHSRKLRMGDFIIVAGRPNKGKTSFLASESTFWAPQLPPDKNIIWLNNEGPGRRIVPTLYRAALGKTIPQLGELARAGLAEAEYSDVVGRRDRIRVIDIHGWTNGMVERVLEDSNPGLIIYDMIDNIKGFGNAARTDLGLEMMYQWARERSVKFDAIGVATSQISNDGDGLMFPTMGMLKDSKTGKQGACDMQLMIGSSNDPTYANARFIGLPKNKMSRPGIPEDPRQEVHFNRDTARFTDVAGEYSLHEHETNQATQQVHSGDADGVDAVL